LYLQNTFITQYFIQAQVETAYLKLAYKIKLAEGKKRFPFFNLISCL